MTGDRGRNWPLLLAVLVAIGLLAALSPSLLPAGVALVFFLVGFAVPVFRVDAVGELILILVAGVLAYVVVMMLGEPDAYLSARGIGPVGASFGLFFLFVALLRLHQRTPTGRDPATAATLFLAVLSMGGISTGYIYPVAAMITLVLLVAACRYGDGGRPSIFKLSRRGLRAMGVMTVIWTLLFAAFITGLPLAYRIGFSMLERAYLDRRTGFGYTMTLGDLDGLSTSDTLILRVSGPKTDHLRGAVYTRYSAGRWLAERRRTMPHTTASDDISSHSGRRRVSLVGGARERYFLPLHATSVRIPDGAVVRTVSGLYLPDDGHRAGEATFELDARRSPARDRPSEEHLLVPPNLERPLADVLVELEAEGMRGRPLLEKVAAELMRRFDYSLHYDVPAGTDPIVGFLTKTKKGHCEYFATAFALLARVGGVPTRMIGGYRVHERNPVGGYYVVREKNAHAWVEAYLPREGWQTFDPTPPSEVFSPGSGETPTLAALIDVAAAKMREGATAIARMSPLEMAAVIGGLLLVWASVRLIRRFRRRPRREQKGIRGYRSPPAVLSAVLERLSLLGMPRLKTEPIESYAGRLRQCGNGAPGVLVDAGELLMQYAAWRFGEVGSEAALVAAFEKWLVDQRQQGERP